MTHSDTGLLLFLFVSVLEKVMFSLVVAPVVFPEPQLHQVMGCVPQIKVCFRCEECVGSLCYQKSLRVTVLI